MTGQATLNTYDIFDTFGWTITGGMASFLAYPARKASVTHQWPEEDGTDIDLSDPHFEAREFTLNCTLQANSRADFKTKYNGLFTLLRESDTLTFYLADIDQTFYIFYKQQNNLKKLSKTLNADAVGVSFDLVFSEVDPNLNIETVYIVTGDGDFIIA